MHVGVGGVRGWVATCSVDQTCKVRRRPTAASLPTAPLPLSRVHSPPLSPFAPPPPLPVVFRAVTAPFDAPHSGGPKKLAVVGSIPELGGWHLEGGIPLQHSSVDPTTGDLVWESAPVPVPPASFPFEYRYVANGHRSSPTSRPLAWDAAPRTCTGTAADADATDRFAFDDADDLRSFAKSQFNVDLPRSTAIVDPDAGSGSGADKPEKP